MYIDTFTKDSMIFSICDYLNVDHHTLTTFLSQAAQKANNSHYFDDDVFNRELNNFIYSHLPHNCIDEILFFHLSRRLNDSINDHTGHNLMDLLTTFSPLSEFLKAHNVEFSKNETEIEIFHRGKFKSLENSCDSDALYLRRRLGYNTKFKDFCFNGFAFKDMLYRNDYARDLFNLPEFIGILAQFLRRPDIANDYLEQSSFYCYEYLLPIKNVLFDDNEDMPNEQKCIYLLNRVLNRLSDYQCYHIDDMYDRDNPMLRLDDFDTMHSKYFIGKELITRSMVF